MKKVLLSSILALGALITNAQTSAGTFSIGGQVGFNSTSMKTQTANGGTTVTTDGPTTTNFTILPQAQYFIIDKFSVGLGIGYSRYTQSQKDVNGNGRTISSGAFQVKPFARYYFMLDEKVGFFGEGAVPLSFGSTKDETTFNNTTTTQDGTISSFGFQLSPGFVFFPSKKIGLEASLGNLFGVTSQSNKYEDSGTTTTYSYTTFNVLNINTISFTMGLSYYFGR